MIIEGLKKYKKRYSEFFPFVAYSIVTIIAAPWRISLVITASFFIYAFFIFWVIWNYASRDAVQEPVLQEMIHKRFAYIILVFSAILIVGTRLFLFVRYGEAPLGYDTGFYLLMMDEAIVSNRLTAQIQTFLWTPLLWLGISKSFVLHGLYVLNQFLIAGSLYMVGRVIAAKNNWLLYTSILLFLFAVSIVQFTAFWWMFYQTSLAIAFLLATIALLYRRSPLALLTATFGAATHTPTFFVFGLAIWFFALVRCVQHRWRKERISRETLLLLILPVFLVVTIMILRGKPYLLQQWYYVSRYKFFATSFPENQIPEALGLFIDFASFRLLNIYLYPFAFTGLLLFIMRGQRQQHIMPFNDMLFLIIFSAFLFILSIFPFVYQHRFLIYFDIVLIVFATYPFMLLLRYFLNDRLGRVVIFLIFFGFSSLIMLVVGYRSPQVFPEELRELKALNERAEPYAYAMATHPLYTPWVRAFSRRSTIAPGYYANRWRIDQWDEFWIGKDNVRRHELLRLYRHPIYIFLGTRIDQSELAEFIRRDPYMQQISPHIWRYDTRNFTLGEIADTL